MSSTPNTPLRLAITRELPINDQVRTLRFCYSACVIDGHCLGWLPAVAYDNYHLKGRIVVLFNNDDLVGFCLHSDDGFELRCLQVWVRRDARLILHGRALVDWLNNSAHEKGLKNLRLWCAVDLEANFFWQALGFTYTCWRWGRTVNGRRHALWRRPVTPPFEPHPQSVWQPPTALAPPTPRLSLQDLWREVETTPQARQPTALALPAAD